MKILSFLGSDSEQLVYLRALKNKLSYNPFIKRKTAMVVYALDSDTYNCGFADKLRGMVSGYALAKSLHIPFKIVHRQPFLLENYLTINQYDWKTTPDEVSFNFWNIKMFLSLDTINRPLKFFRKKPKKQIHIYSNNNLINQINSYYDKEYFYTQLFNELFKPNQRVQEQIDICKKTLGAEYVSVSFRFINLLGDAFEGNHLGLHDEEKESLITNCIDKIQYVHETNSQVKKILVTADSMTFLNRINQLDYVYVIPGKTGHSGLRGNINDELTLKTFLDFLMISKAQKAYLVKGPGMFNSHFSASAANSQGIPFERIDF